MTIHENGKKARILAVGKKAREITDKESRLYTPYHPLVMEKENFELCSKVLQHFIAQLKSKSLFLAPRIILHLTKTSLSKREEQFYKELGLASGGREVVIFLKDELQADELETFFSK